MKTLHLLHRPVTSLGHQEGRRIFREWPKAFKLCPRFLNYVQHIFPGVARKILGGFAPLGYGPASSSDNALIFFMTFLSW